MRYYILQVRIDFSLRRISYELRKSSHSKRAAQIKYDISIDSNELMKFVSIKNESTHCNQKALIKASRYEQAVEVMQGIINAVGYKDDTTPIDCKDFFLWTLKY